MNDEDQLKDYLLNVWNTNPVFRDNLDFLTQVSLRNLPAQIIHESLNRMEDFFRYDLVHDFYSQPCPLHILDAEDTLDLLLENPKSFCRVGDGELFIINGGSISFQEYNKDLAERLCEILQNKRDECYVGIDPHYFQSTTNLPEHTKNYVRNNEYWIRPLLLKYCNRKKLYILSIITCFYLNSKFSPQVYQRHFNKSKELFRGRKLVIFSGETVFDGINYNIFEYAAERKHVFTASKNAWNHYEEILNFARQFPKDVTLCFILGPTATVLAYDLAQEGYTAWDIGHIAKDYDAFMKGIEVTPSEANKFFAPD